MERDLPNKTSPVVFFDSSLMSSADFNSLVEELSLQQPNHDLILANLIHILASSDDDYFLDETHYSFILNYAVASQEPIRSLVFMFLKEIITHSQISSELLQFAQFLPSHAVFEFFRECIHKSHSFAKSASILVTHFWTNPDFFEDNLHLISAFAKQKCTFIFSQLNEIIQRLEILPNSAAMKAIERLADMKEAQPVKIIQEVVPLLIEKLPRAAEMILKWQGKFTRRNHSLLNIECTVMAPFAVQSMNSSSRSIAKASLCWAQHIAHLEEGRLFIIQSGMLAKMMNEIESREFSFYNEGFRVVGQMLLSKQFDVLNLLTSEQFMNAIIEAFDTIESSTKQLLIKGIENVLSFEGNPDLVMRILQNEELFQKLGSQDDVDADFLIEAIRSYNEQERK